MILFQSIDEEMQAQETLKQTKLAVKSEADDMENDINSIRKRLSSQQKEVSTVQKSITAFETKLEQKKAERHELFKTCKVGGR